jgi:hypothetical protein
MPLLLGNEVRKGKASQKEQRHATQTQKTTPTPNVRRRPRANIHQATQGFPPLENGLVGKRLNEPPNSQRCYQCGIITHTHKGERQY